MVPKRKSIEKGGGSYDSSRFVSAEAFERYKKALNVVVRNCIPKRGLDFGEYNVPTIIAYIEKRGWANFYKEPFATMECVVREFYTNAFEQKKREDHGKGEDSEV